MFGFGKKPAPSNRPVATSATDDAPPGEVEKVIKIKQLTWMAKMSADSLAEVPADEHNDEFLDYERKRYHDLRQQSLRLAREITDIFYRDSALVFIIEMLMVAKEEDVAKKLFDVMEMELAIDSVKKTFP